MNYFQRYLAEEFAEDYQEGRISRRKALKLIASVTGSAVVANSILAACAPAPSGEGTPMGVTPAGSTPAGAAPTSAQTTIPNTGSQATAAPTSAATTGATAMATGTAAVETAAPSPEASQTMGATGTPASSSSTTGTPAAYGTVSPGDPSVTASEVQFPGKDGATLLGYQAHPQQGSGPFAVVLVCHENRGLTEHIRDVTRRFAKAGYAALAVDLLSRSGGTGKLSADDVPGALGNAAPDQFVDDFRSGWEYMKSQSFAQAERVGMVGFCFGGGVTWRVATKMPELQAAVPYYGPHPPIRDVPNIQAAVLGIYGGKDARITGGVPEIEAAMKENNKVFEKVIYPDADHAFNNDTGPRYNAEAAKDAWGRTLAWFQKYLV